MYTQYDLKLLRRKLFNFQSSLWKSFQVLFSPTSERTRRMFCHKLTSEIYSIAGCSDICLDFYWDDQCGILDSFGNHFPLLFHHLIFINATGPAEEFARSYQFPKYEVHCVSEVLIFTSAVALSSQNVADLEKRGGTSGGVAILVGKM